MATFPERLKALRQAKGLSQKQMADFLGMQERAYQRYEYGQREPNHETTIKLADYFEVSLDYLMGRTNYSMDANGHITVTVPPDIISADDLKKDTSGE